MALYWKRSRVPEGIGGRRARGLVWRSRSTARCVRLDVVVGARSARHARRPGGSADCRGDGAQVLRACDAVAGNDTPLIAPLPLGATLLRRRGGWGKRERRQPSETATHTFASAPFAQRRGWDLRCWWDRWLCGTRAFDDDDHWRLAPGAGRCFSAPP